MYSGSWLVSILDTEVITVPSVRKWNDFQRNVTEPSYNSLSEIRSKKISGSHAGGHKENLTEYFFN